MTKFRSSRARPCRAASAYRRFLVKKYFAFALLILAAAASGAQSGQNTLPWSHGRQISTLHVHVWHPKVRLIGRTASIRPAGGGQRGRRVRRCPDGRFRRTAGTRPRETGGATPVSRLRTPKGYRISASSARIIPSSRTRARCGDGRAHRSLRVPRSLRGVRPAPWCTATIPPEGDSAMRPRRGRTRPRGGPTLLVRRRSGLGSEVPDGREPVATQRQHRTRSRRVPKAQARSRQPGSTYSRQ